MGLVDIAISMKRTEGGKCQRKLETVSRYADTPSELVIELKEDEYRVLGTPDEISASAKVEKLWTALSESDQTRDELMKKTGLSKQDISRGIGKLGDRVILTFPQFRGHLVKPQLSSLRTRPGSHS